MGDETSNPSGGEAVPRPPTLKDLALLCSELNRLGARYVVVGGLAIIQAGYARLTEDVDLLVETTPQNEASVIEALLVLPDKAARELKPGDVAEYGVVRVGDEILVDLMRSGCGVDYAHAVQDAIVHKVDGIPIPFASPQTLWRMKQTVREKDAPDRLFLRQWHEAQGIPLDPPWPAELKKPEARGNNFLERWWRKLTAK
jgi:hypothetical protein